jgi:hypothetical protein
LVGSETRNAAAPTAAFLLCRGSSTLKIADNGERAGDTIQNDIVLPVIPEPSALTLVGFGLFGAWVLGRRRR